MGVQCSRDKESETIFGVPYYEHLCTEMEKRLILPTISLKEIVHQIKVIEEIQGPFDSHNIIQMYEDHGIPRESFLAPNSIYQELLPDYEDCDMCGHYLLSTALPFSEGTLAEKKDALWWVLQPQEGTASRKTLDNIVKMIIALSIKTIPDLVAKDFENKRKLIEDINMLLLVQSDDTKVEEYANKFYLKKLEERREQDKEVLTRYEYDVWMLKIDGEKLLSSKGNRELFLKYLKNKS
uniref:Uncharacterized protein n=1 Tax=Nyctotherus ovalis TaxID=70075 RepID=A6MI50_NYCOV|nr:hypothetical protein [Nyctotherus ovalis]